ncbi:MFS general substrate transporter, partial [Aureobasidium melanogenum]
MGGIVSDRRREPPGIASLGWYTALRMLDTWSGVLRFSNKKEGANEQDAGEDGNEATTPMPAMAIWKNIMQWPRWSKKNISATREGTVASAQAAPTPLSIRPPSRLPQDCAKALQILAAVKIVKAMRYTGRLPSTRIRGTQRTLPTPNMRTLMLSKRYYSDSEVAAIHIGDEREEADLYKFKLSEREGGLIKDAGRRVSPLQV